MKIIFCVLLVAHTIIAEDTNQKINLEDIERDNLISERRTQGKEVLEGQHTQHLRPPSIHASTNYEVRHGNDAVSTSDITYSHQSQTENQYENHQENDVQYVTVQPQTVQYQEEKEYESQPQSPPTQYRPVHEEGRTYSAPARHSLVSPIIPTPSATPSPYLAQQPQYVYVQAGQSPSQPANNNYDHKSQDDVRYAQGVTYAQQEETSDAAYEQVSHTETEQSGNGISYVPQQYIQYVPYVSQGPDQQTFIMMVPLRNAHTYVQSSPVSYAPQSTYSIQKPQPTPTVTYTHSAPAEENAQLAAPHSTITPAVPSQLHYSVPSYSSYHQPAQPAHSIQYTPHQVQIQQSIEYPSRHEYYHAPKIVSLHSTPQYQSHFQPSYQYGSPQLDFFGSYNKQHSSLLDSYIPSSVILDRQRSYLQKNQLYHQPTSPSLNHIPTASNTHSLNGYNTIAYSTPLGYSYNHLKRSPSLPVSTKLKPKGHKATKLTKVPTKA